MTGLASNAFGDVNVVLEVDEIRQVVYSSPLERRVVAETRPDRFEYGRLGPDQGVTAHAGFRRGKARKGRFFYSGVAVAAIDTHTGHMVLVAEGDRLVLRHAHMADVVEPIDVENDAQQETRNSYRADDADIGKPVEAATENLRHVR